MRGVLQKIAAIAAVLAMLLPGFGTLAETLSAADLPACCNTSHCPLHHHDSRSLQKDKSDCNAKGIPAQQDCSMRACDSAQVPAVGTPLFVLTAPVTLAVPATAEFTISAAALFSPFVTAVPLTPPPRFLAS